MENIKKCEKCNKSPDYELMRDVEIDFRKVKAYTLKCECPRRAASLASKQDVIMQWNKFMDDIKAGSRTG